MSDTREIRPTQPESTWPLASYQPVERRTRQDDPRDEKRAEDRRKDRPRVLRALLRL